MKTKTLLSKWLCLLLVFCLMPVTGWGDSTSATVYVSICQNAAYAETADGALFDRLPVLLTGKETYNLDDCLSAAHALYGDSDHAYASAVGAYGLGITKLWGDTSGNFGYWQNDNSSWSLEDAVADGDYVCAFIYKDSQTWGDRYIRFENTGNIARSCAGTGTRLHLIRPLGFSVDDAHLKRAGLDYWQDVKISYYDSFEELEETFPGAVMHLFYTAIHFEPRKLKHKSLTETVKLLSGE